ncbi:MAG: hypothetical protein GF372_08775, partial [Candidatus Marinimicrobia bacterium]|nr:hypothetical protein [Candidatus Neomarinimicrobiota bacterium]
ENQRGDGDLNSEQVFSAGGAGYLLLDGNLDGIPDSQQDHVISFRPNTSAEYVTLSGESTTRFTNLRTTDPAQFEPAPPPDLEFFYQLFEYNLSVSETGGTSTVTILLPDQMSAEEFYNYGPTPENSEPHWYPFTYDGTTGAEINGNRVTLHFMDGSRGDADLSADGVLTAAGGPVFMIYDGNLDGVPDREQAHVSSIRIPDSQTWLTMEAPDTSSIDTFQFRSIDGSTQINGYQPLYDCIDLQVSGIQSNGILEMTLFLPDTVRASSSLVSTVENGGSETQWIRYDFNGSEGAEIQGNSIRYHIQDGGTADLDMTADGTVTLSTILLQPVGPTTGAQLASENVYAYPNPFNPEITGNNIRYSLEEPAQVTITIYDLGQQVVKKLADKADRPGGIELSESWDGRNGAGDLVANGVYYFLIETSQNERALGKIAIVR